MLDEILGNATDLPITEHATDTHGVTLVNFDLFDLLGMQLSPRIRDLGRITLYRPGPRTETETRFPHAGPLLTRRTNLDLIAEHYDDLLRLAGSLKIGHATAALLVGKLSASGRQNTLAAALKEYGALRRTIYAAKYLSDPDDCRKVSTSMLNSPSSDPPATDRYGSATLCSDHPNLRPAQPRTRCNAELRANGSAVARRA